MMVYFGEWWFTGSMEVGEGKMVMVDGGNFKRGPLLQGRSPSLLKVDSINHLLPHLPPNPI